MAAAGDSPLSSRHVFNILMFALERKSIRSTDVHEFIKNWGTIAEKLEYLVNTGLLEEKVLHEGRVSVNYCLTPKGEFVARMLYVCDKAISGEFDFESRSVDEYIVKSDF